MEVERQGMLCHIFAFWLINPAGTFWCESSSEAWTWKRLIKQMLAKKICYDAFNLHNLYVTEKINNTYKASFDELHEVLQRRVIGITGSPLMATHFMSMRSEIRGAGVAEPTLDTFLNQNNITFPSIIVFVLQQKFTQKWIFAVNLLTLRPFKMRVTESTVLDDS